MIFEEYDAKIEIEKYRDLIKEQEDEINKRQIIVNSLMASMVKTVRNIVPDYSDKMLYAAYWGQYNENNEDDEKNRNMLKFLKTDMFERLFEKTERKRAKFDNIIRYGHDDYAYGFYFTYKDIKFEVRIPNVRNANEDNVYQMDYGKYSLYHGEKKSCWTYIKGSYNLNDIAQAIQDFATWSDGEF